MSYRLIDIICTSEDCRQKKIDVHLQVGEYPLCEMCGQPTERLWQSRSSAGVNSDECDVWATNVICHEDGSPRHFSSKSEMVKEAAKHGMQPHVEHVTPRGTDKSKHTSRWI